VGRPFFPVAEDGTSCRGVSTFFGIRSRTLPQDIGQGEISRELLPSDIYSSVTQYVVGCVSERSYWTCYDDLKVRSIHVFPSHADCTEHVNRLAACPVNSLTLSWPFQTATPRRVTSKTFTTSPVLTPRQHCPRHVKIGTRDGSRDLIRRILDIGKPMTF